MNLRLAAVLAMGIPIAACTASDPGTTMTLSSPAFADQGMLPSAYSCDGANVSPPLAIAGVPRDAKSLALIVEDPDAPNGTFVHWTMWNIDPSVTAIAENTLPAGAVQGRNGAGDRRYAGACPPSGTHRYEFRLYALRDRLAIAPDADATALRAAMDGSIVAHAETMARYARTASGSAASVEPESQPGSTVETTSGTDGGPAY
jgi:Raf kinase inhibitor-like YbhB/YbcL family protein